MAIIIVPIVSGALIIGAFWGIYGSISNNIEGFLVALAGGALLVSAILELINPSLEEYSIPITLTMVLAGAIIFRLPN